MGKIKAGAIIVTGIVGGAIGVGISAIGKGMGNKTVSEIGDSVAESSLLTGDIAGEALEGVAETAVGHAKKDREKKEEGVRKLKRAGEKTIKNVTENFVTVAEATKDVGSNAVKGDKEGAIKAGKKLLKIFTVGMITAGAIKVGNDEEIEINEQVNNNERK